MSNIYKKDTPIVWTIGHSDSSGGTGVQADLHTFHDYGVYGCSVITSLVAQNSFASGYALATERKSVVAQINALDSDMPAKVIKVAAIPEAQVLDSVVKYLDDFDGFVLYDLELENSGELLAQVGTALQEDFLPRVDLFIVNTDEVVALTGRTINNESSMLAAANDLLKQGARSVFITGAQLVEHDGKRLDYWTNGENSFWLAIEAISTVNNRGGGSTLSAAITAGLAKGMAIDEAIKLAKAYVTRGIREGNQIGSGPGSVAHLGLPAADDADIPVLLTSLS
ncbi:bifunctional hydroxymethylpyrimidine kinase/phosphomethylpyrimidine kinase [Oceanicoccus sp. KOV_DT_Chl]|uniref:bifunctional hydroxymethylpyrimidine kinase/phosphomethylpyrimidine kinase n=1 Tax=Oceanicoccus sp. KOV_DT_Chl TaxID=1904639 RepID=UPI00135CAFCE|nr:bifunctional hydroxymethylpyrimidine kinase/phosphomethylpyrimidine kinase [Oceanicoccus sp. KOV_DT_Chl]